VTADDRPHVVIVMDPAQNFGHPALASTRTRVEHVIAWLDAGETVSTICAEYGLTRGDVLVACWFEARYGVGAHPRDEWLDWLEEWEPVLWSVPCDYETVPLPLGEDRRHAHQ
jgi:uncharacterized protein (DUF433 family)